MIQENINEMYKIDNSILNNAGKLYFTSKLFGEDKKTLDLFYEFRKYGNY